MNRGKKLRELSMLGHRKSDAWRVQHIRAEISISRNQGSGGDQNDSEWAKKLASRIHYRCACSCWIRQRVDDYVLHSDKQKRCRD